MVQLFQRLRYFNKHIFSEHKKLDDLALTGKFIVAHDVVLHE